MWMNLFVTKKYVAECEFVHMYMLNDKEVVEREWIYSWTGNEIIKFEWSGNCEVAPFRCNINLHNFTGCPKSSFLYFKSLYFSTIGLGKQII